MANAIVRRTAGYPCLTPGKEKCYDGRMSIATVTSKGQVTIPKEIRDALHIKQGDRLEFVVDDDGTVRMQPLKIDVRDLFGIVATDRKLSIDEMNEIIRRGWAGSAEPNHEGGER